MTQTADGGRSLASWRGRLAGGFAKLTDGEKTRMSKAKKDEPTNAKRTRRGGADGSASSPTRKEAEEAEAATEVVYEYGCVEVCAQGFDATRLGTHRPTHTQGPSATGSPPESVTPAPGAYLPTDPLRTRRQTRTARDP